MKTYCEVQKNIWLNVPIKKCFFTIEGQIYVLLLLQTIYHLKNKKNKLRQITSIKGKKNNNNSDTTKKLNISSYSH